MSPREIVADDLTRAINEVRDPHSMSAWSERVEGQVWEQLRDRVDKQMAIMEFHLSAFGVDLETLQ